MITRRLKEGKTYEDFRKAWFHTIGFGTPSRLYTVISAADAREVIVIGFVETDPENALATARIDVKERLANPLDDVIEPDIGRKFGVLVSEDDFSAEGAIEYRPLSIGGKETDLKEVAQDLAGFDTVIRLASAERELAGKLR